MTDVGDSYFELQTSTIYLVIQISSHPLLSQ